MVRSLRLGARLLVTVVAVLMLSGPVEAQSSRSYYGLLLGATVGDFSDDYGGVQSEDRWGGTAGLVFGVRTANWASVSLEPAWVSTGGGEIGLSYIEVPLVLGGVARSPDDAMRYGAYIGIAPAFKVSCSDDESLVQACGQEKGTIWWLPVGARFLRRTSGSTYVGIDIKYSFPLGDSFDNSLAQQRTWAFRLMLVKGGGPR